MEEEDLNEKIQKIMRQTDYNEETAKEKLIENMYDEISTIKSYLGITEKKETHVRSINQEIYKQIRNKMNASMREYEKRCETSK